MKADSNSWTGANGEQMAENGPVKRSKFLRWGLLGVLVYFIASIVATITGKWSFLIHEAYASVTMLGVLILVVGVINGWGSPFRYPVGILIKTQRAALRNTLADEFEMTVYARANVSATRYCSLALIFLFAWFGYATAEGYQFPTDGRDWIRIGILVTGVYFLVPTIIAEFRIRFPDNDETEVDS